jgi:transcriptional regulator with XRE-family HTH domain
MEYSSGMSNTTGTLGERVGERVHELRRTRGLSIEALASASGVSRSMISLVERGEASPTAVVLDKLATGLGITLASLFEDHSTEAALAPSPLSRRDEQAEWVDPASGYRRRNVSAAGVGAGVQIVEVHFPAGARVTFDTGLSGGQASQHVWVLDGKMTVIVGDTTHDLLTGDCLWMPLDLPRVFHNPTTQPARYAVVLHV